MSTFENKFYDIVMFHYPCQDGLASAWVVKDFHTKQGKSIELYPIAHGKSINMDTFVGKSIIICDYAPQLDILNKLEQIAESITILDHHVTAQKTLENKLYAIFDMNKSGAGITWDYFYPDQSMPLFIQMIQDRDLWKWEINQSKEFTSGFFAVCSTFDEYDFESLFTLFTKLHSSNDNNIIFYIELGKIMTKLTENKSKAVGDDHLKKISYFNFNGTTYKVCVINCSSDITSEVGNYVSSQQSVDFAVLWRYHNPSGNYYVSLRSCGDIDVSVIAKSFGGGGHKNAAGFSIQNFPPTFFDSVNYVGDQKVCW